MFHICHYNLFFTAAGQCNKNFTKQCIKQLTIYTSKHLRQQFGAEMVEICSASGVCDQRATLIIRVADGKKKADKQMVVVAVLCSLLGLAVVVVGLSLLYFRKKR